MRHTDFRNGGQCVFVRVLRTVALPRERTAEGYHVNAIESDRRPPDRAADVFGEEQRCGGGDEDDLY